METPSDIYNSSESNNTLPKNNPEKKKISNFTKKEVKKIREEYNFNYSTENKPELKNSVEDIIIKEISGDKTKLEKVIAKLENLKVDVYNPKSKLRVRNKN